MLLLFSLIYGGFKFTELIRLAYGVLDWGLGHATRSVHVIKALIKNGIDPVLVVSGNSGAYLKSVFPGLSFETLPNSDIVYTAGKPAWQSVINQIPQLQKAKKLANQVANRLAAEGFTHLISDNWYGFHSKLAKNAIITHQTSPLFPLQFPGASQWSAAMFHYLLKPYQHVWIPVEPDSTELIAPLIHHFHKCVTKIGWLTALENGLPNEKVGDWLIVLSGPEWYRTDLEEQLIHYWPKDLPVHFVRGTNKLLTVDKQLNSNVIFYNQLNNEMLEKLWLSTQFLVARSGYSTVMDAIAFGKKAIWIPTPGQTEQQLLGQNLEKFQFGLCLPQSQLNQLPAYLSQLISLHQGKVAALEYQNRLLDVALMRFLNDR